VRDVEPHRWFKRDELEPCPACRRETAIRAPESGSLVCLECGHVQAASTVIDKVQAKVPPPDAAA